MKQGTPGFVGTRMKEAREARGLTASSLADLLGVTRSAVSQYELGIQSPRPEILERACRVLNLPHAFFLIAPDRPDPLPVIFTRSMSASSKTGRLKAARRLDWLRRATEFFRVYVDTPALNMPEFGLPGDPKRISFADIERAAKETRSLWGIADSPIANLVRTSENNGVIVARDDLEPDPLSAVSAWDVEKGQPYIVLGSHITSGPSSRYELARQLGHLVLHKAISKQQLAANNDFALIKEQASRFAAALLLPADTFLADLYSYSLDAMRILKQKWRTPIGVMIRRLENLQVISEEQSKRLWIGRSRRGWQEAEPLEDEIPVERPRLLSESVLLLVEEQVLSKSDILLSLPFSDRDIERFAGLDQGYLTDSMPVISLTPAAQRRHVSGISTERADVVPFPKSEKKAEPKKRKVN